MPLYDVERLEDEAKGFALVLKAPPNLQATNREGRNAIFAVFVGLGAVYGGVLAFVSDDIFQGIFHRNLFCYFSLRLCCYILHRGCSSSWRL